MSDHNRTDADAPPDLPGLTGEAALAPQEPAPAPAGVPAETETRSSAAEDGQSAAPGHAVTDSDDAKSRLPRDLPVLPVRDMVVFPGTIVPLNVAREKSKRLIDAVLSGDKLLVAVAQRRSEVEDPGLDDIYRVGTVATVLKLLRMPDGSQSLLVHGLTRVGIEAWVASEPFWRATVNPHEDETPAQSIELEALAYTARQTALQVLELTPNAPEEARVILTNIDKPGQLADYLAANLTLGLPQKQELLETFDVAERLRKITATLNNQLEILQLSQKIQADVRSQMEDSQREYYLQQQLKAIQKELGEGEGRSAEITELRHKVDEADMPEPVRREAERELGRLERLPAGSPENGVVRDYLDWLILLPWNKETPDNLDLARAEQILDADHYGLEKIKRRILEYLAVRKLKPEGKGPILCFIGPPGVGKTSLGQSIARALERRFIRVSLGGVRDEADIRGHRRTYIGSIPGRIIQEIRKAASRNPVFMLDEVDKIGADFRGDPAAALLEVLDPQQNHSFTDHYLGVPFDLSKTLFIATANTIDPIAPPLRDRMEIISLAGYTTPEKLEIARRYLVRRQLDENGLSGRNVEFTEAALLRLIEGYTREAGVRELERVIGSVCRGIAAKVARDQSIDACVDPDDLVEYLGPVKYESEQVLRARVAGVATGLAYTPFGGEIIFIEATQMPGRGNFTLTGQIGGVMRESAQAALSLVRARARPWHVNIGHIQNRDLHIHVPAGGVPKDGPSAGVAMVTALVSLFSGQPTDPFIAMTGEITLRGLVLPVGGIKEKILAAHRAGIRKVVLPRRNQPDLHEVPPVVQQELEFVFATHIEEVIAAALPALKIPVPQEPGATEPTPTLAKVPRRRATAGPPARSRPATRETRSTRRAGRGAG